MSYFSDFIKIGDAIKADGTCGRVLRSSYVILADGTDANTVKITMGDWWNGDDIAETDNVVKGATTGSFTLNAAGNTLNIENTGLSGTVLAAWGHIAYNQSTTCLSISIDPQGGTIRIIPRINPGGTAQDITSLVDDGSINIYVTYVTDA